MPWDDRTRRAVTWALVKGILPSVLLMLVSVVLWQIWPRDPRIAAWAVLTGSFLLFLKSYARDWRLRWFTILLPGVMAVACCLFQLMIIKTPPLLGPMWVGVGAGVLLGVLRGAGHSLFLKDGHLFAKRTLLVMAIWLATYLVTQSAALFGWVQVTRWGLSGTVFSTSIIVVFTVVLFGRYLWRWFGGRLTGASPSSPTAQTVRSLAVLLLGAAAMFVTADAAAQRQPIRGGDASSLGVYAGAPLADELWGVRYGKTTYQAELNPKLVATFTSAHGQWYTHETSYTTYRSTLTGWKLTGGQLVVDWDAKTATVTPITVAVEYTEVYFDDEGEVSYSKACRHWGVDTAILTGLVQHNSGDLLEINNVVSSTSNEQDTTTYPDGRTSEWNHDTGTTNILQVTRNNYFNKSGAKPNVAGDLAIGRLERPNGKTSTFYALKPGTLNYHELFHCLTDALDAINGRDQFSEETVVFRAVESTGRAPAGVHLVDDVNVYDGEWTKRDLEGVTRLRGRLLGPSASSQDAANDQAYLRYARDFAPHDSSDWHYGSPPAPGQRVYGAPAESQLARALSDVELVIDWDRRTAELTPFSVETVDRARIEHNLLFKRVETFTPVRDYVGRVKFNVARLREIDDGRLTLSSVRTPYSLEPSDDPDEPPTPVRMERETRDPVTFRGEPVQLMWQGVPMADGAILVRVYARPWADTTSMPASYDILFEYAEGAPMTAAQAGAGPRPPGPVAPPADGPDESSTDSDGPDDGADDGDDDDDMISEADLDAIAEALQAQGLPDEAVGAGLVAGLALLLAGAGMNTAMSVASAVANLAQQGVDDAAQALAGAVPTLIDPRDGLVLEADGDQVYWDDDAGWIDRGTAQQWINEIDGEHAQRDWEVQQSQAQWDAEYDDRLWYMINHDDPSAESLNNLANAYDMEDFIDENMHMLSPELQQQVQSQLDGVDWSDPYNLSAADVTALQNVANAVSGTRMNDFVGENIGMLSLEMQQHVQNQLDGVDWSDPTSLSAEDLNALQHTASAVLNIRQGQQFADQAEQMHSDITWTQASAFGQTFAYGVTRFGLTMVNPVLGIGASGAYGYYTAPAGSEIKHAAIAVLASGADLVLGGMNPSSVLWNAGTGASIAGLEQAAYGHDWEQIKNGMLMGGVANGVFAFGQKPGVRTHINSLNHSLTSHLGLNGPKPPTIHGPATFVNDPSTGLPGSGAVEFGDGTVRFLGQGADGTTPALGPRPGLDDGATGPRPPMDGSRTTIGAADADAGVSTFRPPMDGGQTGIRTASLDDAASGMPPSSTNTAISPNRPSLDQTQTGIRPMGVDDASVRPPVSGDELMSQFQSETGVKITGISRDPNGNVRVTFDPDDLTDYSVYPGQRDAAEQLLTDKWTNMHAEAEFQSRPPVYDVPGEVQTNHGVNNGVRDQHVTWLTEADAVQKLPDNYDPSTLPQRSLDDINKDLSEILEPTSEGLRNQLDAEQDGGHSRTFPEGEGVWNWPEDGSVPRSEKDWMPPEPPAVKESRLLAEGWTQDRGGWRSPEVNEIVRAHPELNDIDQTMRRAFSESGYGRNVDGDHFTKFQGKLGEHVDMSNPAVREQVARWTYYVADRKTGTPPWFRTDN